MTVRTGRRQQNDDDPEAPDSNLGVDVARAPGLSLASGTLRGTQTAATATDRGALGGLDGGIQDALSDLVRRLQHPMYRMALRFLGHPHDAQDACQEILIRIVTHLGRFERRSKFTTWAYTVATRSLLRTRKRFVESSVQGPGEFAAFLDDGMGDIDTTMEEAEYRLLCEERQLHQRPRSCPGTTSRWRRIPARRCGCGSSRWPGSSTTWSPSATSTDSIASPRPDALWENLRRRYPTLLDAG